MSDLVFSELRQEQIPELIARIREIMLESEAHNTASFSREWWEWQYQALPTGEAHTYVVIQDGDIRAYYHVPVYRGRVGHSRKKFAVIQGVAVSAQLRGQGVFRRLAEYAHQQLTEIDIDLIYTFPNDKSIHTFIKYNDYTHVQTLKTYVLPVACERIIASRLSLWGWESVLGVLGDAVLRRFRVPLDSRATITKHTCIDESLAEVFAEHQERFDTTLVRDASYLRWRFAQRPSSTHHVLALSRGGQTEAIAVFKEDEILGVPSLLLMDFAHRRDSQHSLLQLLSDVKMAPRRYISRPFALIFTTGSDVFLHHLSPLGFLPVPRRLNPRPINLLVKNLKVSDTSPLFAPEGWRVTLGDWDVF